MTNKVSGRPLEHCFCSNCTIHDAFDSKSKLDDTSRSDGAKDSNVQPPKLFDNLEKFVAEGFEWLTTEQAAYYLQVSVPTLRNDSSNGKVPYYKYGKRNRYRLSELRQLLLSNKRGGFNGNQT